MIDTDHTGAMWTTYHDPVDSGACLPGHRFHDIFPDIFHDLYPHSLAQASSTNLPGLGVGDRLEHQRREELLDLPAGPTAKAARP